MLGGSCSPCCCPCSEIDNKPCTDPADEGTWLPPAEWPSLNVQGFNVQYGGIDLPASWSFQDRETHGPGNTWFFYGSGATSRLGGNASLSEQWDWGNLCNWYSRRTTAPPTRPPLFSFAARATRLPDENAIVHAYSTISVKSVGPRVVRHLYFWPTIANTMFTPVAEPESQITATHPILTTGFVSAGVLLHRGVNYGTINGGVVFIDPNVGGPGGPVSGQPGGNGFNSELVGVVNDGALFIGRATNYATVNGGAEFHGRRARNAGGFFDGSDFPTSGVGTVNGGAKFFDTAANRGFVNGGAMFFQATPSSAGSSSNIGTVNDGAEFNDNTGNLGAVFGGAVFYNSSRNIAGVLGGAVFNDATINQGEILGGADFFGNSRNEGTGTVNDGAIFHDNACSTRSRAVNGVRFFVAHFADFPTCNGTAPPGSDPAATCGCN